MKRILSTIMCLLVAATTLGTVACGKSEAAKIKDPNILRVLVWEGGYGRDYVDSLGRGFEALYPGKTVDVTAVPSDATISLELTADPSDNKYDVILSQNETSKIAYTDYTIKGVQHAFVEISDVFEASKDKMFNGVYDYMSSQNGGDNYILPVMTTITGIIYNKEIFEDCGLTHTPRTTEELFEFCDIIKGKGYVPFIFSGKTDYYTPNVLSWWIQYQGWEEVSNYYQGKVEIDGDLLYSPDIFKQNGRLYAMENLERLIGQNDKYTDGSCMTHQFMDAQYYFVSKDTTTQKYKYAMMTNGGWLENEMREFVTPGDTPLDMMLTPLTSDIVYADPAKSKDAQTPVTDEQTLRQIVSYVRGEINEKPTGVPDSFIEKVREAALRSRAGLGFNAVIPSASKKQEMAKDFLKYIYSDDGIERVALSNCGGYVPVNYDYASIEGFDEALTNLQKTVVSYFTPKYTKEYLLRNHPIVYIGALAQISHLDLYEAFAAINPADRKSAKDVYQETINYYTAGNTWTNLLRQSGLL